MLNQNLSYFYTLRFVHKPLASTTKKVKMKSKFSLFAIGITFTFFLSCNLTQKKEIQQVEKSKTDCNDVHWSHNKGKNGSVNWKNLCDGFSDCGGKSQSPIDIITNRANENKELRALIFNYGESKVNIINNSHTVQFNVDGDNTVNLNGKEYNLLQFHYHALSEHTINGKHFPLEVHFVHKHSATDFAVLSVMFVEGKEYDLFKKYAAKFPSKKGDYKSDEKINLLSLFPKNKSYYNYSGSLTTPPCSEVVNWYVLKTHVEASKEQIDLFSKILTNNYRPTLPLKGRKVKLYSE